MELGERPGRQYVTRLPQERFLPENIQPTFKSSRQSIMLWGAIIHGRQGPLIRLQMSETKIGKNGKKQGGGFGATEYVP